MSRVNNRRQSPTPYIYTVYLPAARFSVDTVNAIDVGSLEPLGLFYICKFHGNSSRS